MADLQRTEEWHMARCGKATGSRFDDIVAVTKAGKPTAGRESYLVEVVTEILTGQPLLIPQNYAMKWGADHESDAKDAYQFMYDVEVIESGFIQHQALRAGCSPDGLIGQDGGIEIKCPANSTVHVNTWRHGMPPEHMAQVQGLMWITGRQWVDFISFDPRMPQHLQLYVQRIERDADYIAMLEAKVIEFLADVDALIASLMKAA